MSEDPHALKLYIDGNAYKNPGGPGGFACVAKYPDAWNRPDEVLIERGYHETTNNRMELQACIAALEYVGEHGPTLGVERVQVVTDSLYVHDSAKLAHIWRSNGWKNAEGRPVANADLWKAFLRGRAKTRIRTDIIWCKGKKTPVLKLVDKTAKAAGLSPHKHDRGFRSGKVSRSKLKGVASLFPACGQTAVIRVYRSALPRKGEHKLYFEVFEEVRGEFISKNTAYAPLDIINELHRGHAYRVTFNDKPAYPLVTALVEEVVLPSFPIAQL